MPDEGNSSGSVASFTIGGNMDKLERVRRAFRGEETDHVPVCLWKHVASEYWNNDDAFIKQQLDFYKATDIDFIKLSADGYFGWPSPLLNNLNHAKTLYQMKPLGQNHPFIRGQIERTRKLIAKLNGDCCTFYLIFAPLSYLRLQIGYPKMMQLMAEDPDAVLYAEQVIAEDVKYLVKGILEEAGADGIFYSVQNAEKTRFSYEFYRKYITPPEKEVLDYADHFSEMNVLHCCAWEGIPNRLEDWADYQTPVVSWSRFIDNMDVREAKAFFGKTVWGGFDNRPGSLLYTGTREEIAAETRRLIRESEGRQFIVGPDCSIHDELPEERIRWIVEAARKQ